MNTHNDTTQYTHGSPGTKGKYLSSFQEILDFVVFQKIWDFAVFTHTHTHTWISWYKEQVSLQFSGNLGLCRFSENLGLSRFTHTHTHTHTQRYYTVDTWISWYKGQISNSLLVQRANILAKFFGEKNYAAFAVQVSD